MDLQRKLAILADAAKYDASCASSGTETRNSRSGLGMGSTDGGMGICHSYAPDGRCISLLKVLLTNACNFDCLYCVNRASSNVPRARFTVDEIVALTLDFYRRNYIEGLFLSSGIIRSPSYTMEQMVRVARSLREQHRLPRLHPPEDDPRRRRSADRRGGTLMPTASASTSNCRARPASRRSRRKRTSRAIRRTMGRLRLKLEEANEPARKAQPPRLRRPAKARR